MCRSVPQIAVRLTRISTSFMPTIGSGTSSSQMPLAALRLTSAFMFWSSDWRSRDSAVPECGAIVHQAGQGGLVHPVTKRIQMWAVSLHPLPQPGLESRQRLGEAITPQPDPHLAVVAAQHGGGLDQHACFRGEPAR